MDDIYSWWNRNFKQNKRLYCAQEGCIIPVAEFIVTPTAEGGRFTLWLN